MRGEFFPSPDREVTKRKSANAFPKKAESGVANRGGHAANLAVFAFSEFKAQPGVDDAFAIANRRVTIRNWGSLLECLGPTGKAGVAFDDDASASKLFKGSGLGFPFHKDEISTAVFEARTEKAIFEDFLISEKKEAFGVHVEPPKREASRREVELFQGALAFVSRVGVELT